ncbi:DNA primase DnaG [Nanoarchaeota archaeon]
MAKIAQVSAKYIINANISIDGVVDRPDVIGAIFGQTEGLLGTELELRELQRSGRIGRIEVNLDTKGGKTKGAIVIPSSLDKAETAIIGAAMEIIERIGPCNARVRVEGVEDVRVNKRKQVVERAKELLKDMMDKMMPDSQELSDEVAYSVRVMEIQEYGKERLPAGPAVEDSDEVIVVEGRADVLNLLKHGFKNIVAMNGTDVPETIKTLSQHKILTVFVDGDRGGDLIVKGVMGTAEIDFITKAPDGKEVEELTKKEIHKALRGKIAAEQYKLDTASRPRSDRRERARPARESAPRERAPSRGRAPASKDKPTGRAPAKKKLTDEEKESFSGMLEDLIGTRGAYILDQSLNILGKVPVSELTSTIKSLKSGIYAVIFDGTVEKELLSVAEDVGVSHLIGMDSKVTGAKINVLTSEDM